MKRYLSFLLTIIMIISLVGCTGAGKDESSAESIEVYGFHVKENKLLDYNGNEVKLSDFKGKPVVINFWATWCTPCCNELPHFDELSRNHSEDVVVIALHSQLVTDDVENYLSQFDYQMPFGLDATGEIITSFNGSTMLPQTIVIDANGIITYNKVGSVTYEMLEKLVEDYPLDIKVAVMGCVVNGPGEAKEADLGIAGGIGEGLLIKKGEIVKKVPEAQLLQTLKDELDHWNE